MNTVKILIGNIGSGKSTYTRDYPGVPILCKDDVRIDFASFIDKEYLFDPTVEEIIRDMIMDAFEVLLHLQVKNIIIDETNLSMNFRAQYLHLAKKYGYNCEAVVFENRGMESHVDARMTDPRGVDREYWETVYKKLQDYYQYPSGEEGFDVITNYTWKQEA